MNIEHEGAPSPESLPSLIEGTFALTRKIGRLYAILESLPSNYSRESLVKDLEEANVARLKNVVALLTLRAKGLVPTPAQAASQGGYSMSVSLMATEDETVHPLSHTPVVITIASLRSGYTQHVFTGLDRLGGASNRNSLGALDLIGEFDEPSEQEEGAFEQYVAATIGELEDVQERTFDVKDKMRHYPDGSVERISLKDEERSLDVIKQLIIERLLRMRANPAVMGKIRVIDEGFVSQGGKRLVRIEIVGHMSVNTLSPEEFSGEKREMMESLIRMGASEYTDEDGYDFRAEPTS